MIGTHGFANARLAPRWFGIEADFCSNDDLSQFTRTAIGTGTNAIPAGVRAGVHRFTHVAANDGVNSQGTLAGHVLTNQRPLQFLARIASSAVATLAGVFGVANIDTALRASPPNDWIVFRLDGDGVLDVSIRAGGAEVAVALDVLAGTGITLANNTFIDLSFEVNRTTDGITVVFAVNGRTVRELRTATVPAGALALSYESTNSAVGSTTDIDYVAVREQR